jgi:serine/threonine protein kinase
MTAESSIVLGSVSYLSPEQVQRGIADARSDVYSAGITAFEIFTGENHTLAMNQFKLRTCTSMSGFRL